MPFCEANIQGARMANQNLKDVIKDRYGKIARGEANFCCPACGPTTTDQCLAVGYTAADLSLVPESAILGVGCGNPAALAGLSEGETVLDLGAGAGIDVFLAAKKVGDGGRVIGVDLTGDMVAKARQLAREHGFGNVEFRQGDIEHLPVDSASVDVVISNCVINLTPDKLASFTEIRRVLKPGGRILIADLVTTGDLPPDVRASAAAWADCLAGAMAGAAYLETIRRAGFVAVAVVSESPYEAPGMDPRLQGKILSVKIRALKPEK
jgi:arsenite methyltransferase